MVGRVTPGYPINDNPGTSGRSLGYGGQFYASDYTSWVQQDPGSLRLQNIPSVSRAEPGFAQGRSHGYGVGLPGDSAGKTFGYGVDLPEALTSKYPGFLKDQVTLPVLGGVTLGTIAIIALVAFLVLKKK